MKNFIYITILLSAFTLSGESRGKFYSVQELEKLLLSKNLKVQSVKLNEKIAVQKYRREKIFLKPEFGFSSGKGKSFDRKTERSLHEYSIKTVITNPVKQNFINKKNRAIINLEQSDFIIFKNRLLHSFREHIFALQYFSEKKSYILRKRKSLKKISEIAALKAELGEIRAVDRLRSEIEVKKNSAELFRINRKINSEKNIINAFLNNSLSENFSLEKSEKFIPVSGLFEKKLRDISDISPLRLRAEKHAEIRKLTLMSEKAGLFPDLHAGFSKGKEMDADIWKIHLGISFPLFNGRANRIREASLQAQKAETEKNHTKLHIRTKIKNMLLNLKSLEKEISVFRSALLRTSKENTEISEQLYLTGEISLNEYLYTQNNWFDIQTDYLLSVMIWKELKSEIETFTGVKP